jgi:hypothetical protein
VGDSRGSRRAAALGVAVVLYGLSLAAAAHGPSEGPFGPRPVIRGWQMQRDWLATPYLGAAFAAAHGLWWAGAAALAAGRLRAAGALGWCAAALAAGAWGLADVGWSGRPGEGPGPAYPLWLASAVALALGARALRRAAAPGDEISRPAQRPSSSG